MALAFDAGGACRLIAIHVRTPHLNGGLERYCGMPKPVEWAWANENEFPRAALLFEVLAESTRNETIASELQAHSRSMRELVAKVLQKGQARGEIDPALDPETTAAVLISLMDGARALALRDCEIDPHQAAATFDRLIRRSVASALPGPHTVSFG